MSPTTHSDGNNSFKGFNYANMVILLLMWHKIMVIKQNDVVEDVVQL